MDKVGGKGMTRERDRIQENANKYIVKNCKSNYKLNGKYVCGAPRIHHYFCQNCTDCIIKQVINKCKYYQNKIGRTPQYRAGFVDATSNILQLFDIEEIKK